MNSWDSESALRKNSDFYTSLTTDKRFIALDNETWTKVKTFNKEV